MFAGTVALGAVVHAVVPDREPLDDVRFTVASGRDIPPLAPATERDDSIELTPPADADRPQRRWLDRSFLRVHAAVVSVPPTAAPDEPPMTGATTSPVAPNDASGVAALEPRVLPFAAPPIVRPGPALRLPREPVTGAAPWQRFAVASPPHRGPVIAIVIDDAGLDRERLRRFTQGSLKPLTIAFLPYATDLPEQVAMVRRAGHEVLLHLPMEPLNSRENPGPNAILTGLSADALAWRLSWNFDRLEGTEFLGVNNHMGSRATTDPAVMTRLMSELRARGLLFLDSRTSPRSVGTQIAEEMAVPNAGRDVFLDNVFTVESVLQQLAQTEEVARRQGFAVAIGHVQPWTLVALERWVPTLGQKGIALVGISTIVRETREGRFASLNVRSAQETEPAGR